MKNRLSFLIALFTLSTAFAQIYNPVQWSFELEVIDQN
jgi:hypothetical protein